MIISQGVFGSFAKIQVVKEDDKMYVRRIKYKKAFGQVDVHKLLDHPNIIKYLGETEIVENEKTLPVDLLEYAEHRDLYEYFMVDEKTMSHDTKAKVLIDVLRGLQYLHTECRLVHMDIKLENILLTKDMTAKIADFDFTVLVGEPLTFINIGQTFIRPPELLDKNKQHEAAFSMDMWSMGIVVYELFDNSHRLDGLDMEDHLAGIRNPLLPKKVNELVHSLIIKDPSERLNVAEAMTLAVTLS